MVNLRSKLEKFRADAAKTQAEVDKAKSDLPAWKAGENAAISKLNAELQILKVASPIVSLLVKMWLIRISYILLTYSLSLTLYQVSPPPVPRAKETPTPTQTKQRTTPTKRVASPSPSTGSSSSQRTRSNSASRKPDPPSDVPSSTTAETPKKRSRATTFRTVRESSQVDIDDSFSNEDIPAARSSVSRESSNVPTLDWFFLCSIELCLLILRTYTIFNNIV